MYVYNKNIIHKINITTIINNITNSIVKIQIYNYTHYFHYLICQIIIIYNDCV